MSDQPATAFPYIGEREGESERENLQIKRLYALPIKCTGQFNEIT